MPVYPTRIFVFPFLFSSDDLVLDYTVRLSYLIFESTRSSIVSSLPSADEEAATAKYVWTISAFYVQLATYCAKLVTLSLWITNSKFQNVNELHLVICKNYIGRMIKNTVWETDDWNRKLRKFLFHYFKSCGRQILNILFRSFRYQRNMTEIVSVIVVAT